MTEQKQPLHVVGGTTHATEAELLRLRAEIDLRDVQQTAIAELGQAALTGVDPHMLLGQACALIEKRVYASEHTGDDKVGWFIDVLIHHRYKRPIMGLYKR